MSLSPDALRMYIVFRADLPEMTRAKGEVQAAHAAASLIYKGMENHPSRIKQYMGEFEDHVDQGQAKVCMEVLDSVALYAMTAKLLDRGVPYVLIEDAAHTVFDKPTVTCLAFGPCGKTDGNAITRDARMRH